MDRQQPELKTEDVQLPPLFYMSYPVLKRVLQYVYGSSRGSAALQCRLVCRSFDEVMLRNVRLHLDYRIKPEPNRCQLSLKGLTFWGKSFSTDQLINSSLIDRIFTMDVARGNTDFFDEADLVRLASRFNRLVDVTLFSSNFLPLLPLAEMPQIRVVEVEKMTSRRDLTPAELNFLANLPHLNRLSMSRTNVQQLSRHADRLNITQLKINWEFSSVQNLNVNFIDNFSHLQTLNISGFICTTDMPDFTGVRLPRLVKCELFLSIRPSFTLASELDSTQRLFTSMHSAMPKLKDLRYSTGRQRFSDPNQVAELISLIFQFCPPTVKDFSLNFNTTQEGFVLIRWEWEWLFRTLFTSILDSNVTRVSLSSCFSPILDARLFQFRKSRSGEQVGQPVETMKFNTPVHNYQLKRGNGQICNVDVDCSGYIGF